MVTSHCQTQYLYPLLQSPDWVHLGQAAGYGGYMRQGEREGRSTTPPAHVCGVVDILVNLFRSFRIRVHDA